jgi:hypothetical protein
MQPTLIPKIDLIHGRIHELNQVTTALQSDAVRAGMMIASVRTDLDDCLRILAAGRQQPELFGPGGAA